MIPSILGGEISCRTNRDFNSLSSFLSPQIRLHIPSTSSVKGRVLMAFAELE